MTTKTPDDFICTCGHEANRHKLREIPRNKNDKLKTKCPYCTCKSLELQ